MAKVYLAFLVLLLAMSACQPSITPSEIVVATDVRVTSTSPVIFDEQPVTQIIPEIVQSPIPNQIVISLSDAIAPEEIATRLEAQGIRVQNVRAIEGIQAIIIETTSPNILPWLAEINEILPNVIAEPDYYAFAQSIEIINDPLYPQQWAFSAMRLSPDIYAQLPQTSTRIALIDSGICDHPDISSQIEWDLAWDYVENDAMPQDEFSHGCPIAHLVVAQSNTIGILGVAPYARIIPYRVLNGQGVGKYSDIASAIIRATDNDARIINLSLGGVQSSTLVINAIEYALQNGVVVVASAGNSGIEQALFPANYPPVIAIGSVDQIGIRSRFSNFGTQVDYYAPGSELISADKNGLYRLYEGTSFSSGYASALLAMEYSFGNTSFAFDNANRLRFSTDSFLSPTPIETETAIITVTPTASATETSTTTPSIVPTITEIYTMTATDTSIPIEIDTVTPTATLADVTLDIATHTPTITAISTATSTDLPTQTPIIIPTMTVTEILSLLPSYYCVDGIDKVMSIEDIEKTAQYYRQTVADNPELIIYDIYPDGIIDIYDLQIRANHLGSLCE